MKDMKLTNTAAKKQLKPGTAARTVKKSVHVVPEERDYFPVMVELTHLLERTHRIAHEDEIMDRIKALELADPATAQDDGIYWQTREDGTFLLFDERSLTRYKDLFAEYLDAELIQNLMNFLSQTNLARQAEFESAAAEDRARFGKINVVNLG